MNTRKNIDYSEMYAALDAAMAAEMSQMELYYEIGKVVSRRSEKGAAVMAGEYLTKAYQDVKGFSPRNLRRMRDFYRTYENHAALLSMALQIGWTQNVVIMETDMTIDIREWYLKAAKQFGWSKAELAEKIGANAHEKVVLAIEEDVCYVVKQEYNTACSGNYEATQMINAIRRLIKRYRYRWIQKKGGLRRWPIMLCLTFTEKPTAFMRC